jgi:tetratricopeptide (TPR) repeat protein
VSRRAYPDALADLTRAVELDPKNPDVLLSRAKLHLQMNKRELARADLDRAIGLKPDLAEALGIRAYLKLEAKDLAGAQSDFDAATGNDPVGRLNTAAYFVQAGDYAEGVANLDRWVAANPKHDKLAEALNLRCWARAQGGVELNQALADCDAALKLSRHNPAYLDSRGLVHLRLGQYDASIADYDMALRLRPNVAWSLYGRGLAKQHKGLKAEGDADLKAATAISPDLPEKAKRVGLGT